MYRNLFFLAALLFLLSACNDDNYYENEDIPQLNDPIVVETEEIYLLYSHAASDVQILEGEAKRIPGSEPNTGNNFGLSSGTVECTGGGSIGLSFGHEEGVYPQFGIQVYVEEEGESSFAGFVAITDEFDGEIRSIQSIGNPLYECGNYQYPEFRVDALTEDMVTGTITGDFFYMILPLVNPNELIDCVNWGVVEDLVIEFSMPYTNC